MTASPEGSATGSPMSASVKLAKSRYVIAVHDLERSARYYAYGMRDFNVADLDGNELCFGMESKR